ncbi:MAG: hypothetical protein LBD48_04795 [Treponema sp.]|nr:hypothetical protein [Treponema sp.]
MKQIFSFTVFAFIPLAVYMCAACSGSGIKNIQREDMFSLDIGLMEDQIALYNLEGDNGVRRTDFAMRDGFFYISDGNGGKIVRYNSYGDILFMIYNEETNPEPVSLKTNIEDSAQVTRWAFTYPLRSPGEIAVDSRKHIYTEDRLPYERHSFDEENKALLDSIILHFDADGRFIEYLGQGGKGGSPFPRIAGLYTSIRDEIAVVCRVPSGWNIYWYNAQGEQLYLVPLKTSAIPAPPDWTSLSASVDSIMAAPDSRKLYIKVDYYRDTIDESTNTRASTEPVSSVIWTLNIETGSYESSLEVPFYEYSFSERGRTVTARMLYSMLGVIRNGKVFLYFPVETGYSILILDTGSKEQRRGLIQVGSDELQYNDFSLSAEGILSAMLVNDWQIQLVWWRMDNFIGDSP